jgi:hypothetical protein
MPTLNPVDGASFHFSSSFGVRNRDEKVFTVTPAQNARSRLLPVQKIPIAQSPWISM